MRHLHRSAGTAGVVVALLLAGSGACSNDTGDTARTATSGGSTIAPASGGSTSAPSGPPTTPVSSPPASVATVTGQPLVEPSVLASAGGKLTATLDVTSTMVDLGGVELEAQTFNGSYMPPTLVMQPGDHVDVTIQNHLKAGTNLHVHGMHVSPVSPGDDVLISIAAGASFNYVYDLPADISPGTYWYHSHEHGSSEEQVFSGLSGLIIVGGLEKLLPLELQNITQHSLALKDFQVDKEGKIPLTNIDSNASTTRTVDGQVMPVLTMRPGETQLWRLANIGADIFYRASLGGDVTFHVIAEDANPVQTVWSAQDLVLPPGKRYDVLVQAPPSGTLTFKTLSYDQQGDNYPEVPLATVNISGAAATPSAFPTTLGHFDDLTGATIANDRRFVFSEENAQNQFFINGQQFDHNRVDTTVKLGTTEQWTLSNTTSEQHPFHIHVDDFQVMSVNGQPYTAQSLQDTVIIPAKGEVVIRLAFKDFVGKFVYHCHILNHEDHGMMAIVEVVP